MNQKVNSYQTLKLPVPLVLDFSDCRTGRSKLLFFICYPVYSTVDPWTAQFPLHGRGPLIHGFLSLNTYHSTTQFTIVWIHRCKIWYREQAVKLYWDFQLCGGSVPQTPWIVQGSTVFCYSSQNKDTHLLYTILFQLKIVFKVHC